MGAGDHSQPYTVPDHCIYKVADVPKLKEVEDALARQCLKNPWLRNDVWRYDPKQFGTFRQNLRILLGRGFLNGLGLTVLTVALQNVFGDTHDHKNGDDHH